MEMTQVIAIQVKINKKNTHITQNCKNAKNTQNYDKHLLYKLFVIISS